MCVDHSLTSVPHGSDKAPQRFLWDVLHRSRKSTEAHYENLILEAQMSSHDQCINLCTGEYTQYWTLLSIPSLTVTQTFCAHLLVPEACEHRLLLQANIYKKDLNH